MFDKIAGWSSIIGAVVGIPALLFSILAFIEANKAKTAAERTEERVAEVRGALRELTIAEEFQQLSLRAAELLLFLEANQYNTAHYVARELRFDLNRAIIRWDPLEADTKVRLSDASSQLKQITNFLHGRNTLSEEQRNSIFIQCDDVVNALRSETGKIQTRIERR
jgi:hypothetical protein